MKRKVLETAGILNLTQVLPRYPYEMSGGQQQRVAAARALVTDPALILADEPTGSLDSHSSRVLLSMMQEMNQKLSATILMVTHDAFSASYCRRILFIKDGRIFNELNRGEDSRRIFSGGFWRWFPFWEVSKVTLCKLIFRNVKKNLQDYLIYFLTLMLSVSIFYAFNSIENQPALQNLRSTKQLLADQTGIYISILSVMIAVVLAFLILYANRFLQKRRKKELGIYLLRNEKEKGLRNFRRGDSVCGRNFPCLRTGAWSDTVPGPVPSGAAAFRSGYRQISDGIFHGRLKKDSLLLCPDLFACFSF